MRSGRTNSRRAILAALVVLAVSTSSCAPGGDTPRVVGPDYANLNYAKVLGGQNMAYNPCPVYESASDLVKRVVSEGGSVLLATVSVDETSHSPNGQSTLARLSDTTTLAGPEVSNVVEGWIHGTERAKPEFGVGDRREWSMWAPDGSVVAVVLPADARDADRRPTVRLAPVDGAWMIVSEAGCWRDHASTKHEYSKPLEELTNSQTVAWAGTFITATSLPAFVDAAKTVERER